MVCQITISFFFALVAITVAQYTTIGSSSANAQSLVSNVAGILRGPLKILDSSTQLGVKLTLASTQGITNVGKHVVKTIANLKSEGIKGATEILHKSIDLVNSIFYFVPGYGLVASVAGDIIKFSSNVNAISQPIISGINHTTHNGLNAINNLVTASANMISRGVNVTTGLGINIIDTGEQVANNIIGTFGKMAKFPSQRMKFLNESDAKYVARSTYGEETNTMKMSEK